MAPHLVTLLPSGGIDAADYLTPRTPTQLLSMRKRGIRLLATYTKSLRPGDAEQIGAAGMMLALIYEAGAGWAAGGAAAGQLHGTRCVSQLRGLGVPHGVPVIGAVDYNTQPGGSVQAAAAAWRAFRDVLAPSWPAGAYGDYELLAAVGAESVLNWQAAARSWGPQHPAAHVLQYPSTPEGIDPGRILRPVTCWNPSSNPPKEPHVMPIIVSITGCTVKFMAQAGSLVLLWTGPGDDPITQHRLNLLRLAGASSLQLNVDDLHTYLLAGALPYGDPGRQWADSDFGGRIPGTIA